MLGTSYLKVECDFGLSSGEFEGQLLSSGLFFGAVQSVVREAHAGSRKLDENCHVIIECEKFLTNGL